MTPVVLRRATEADLPVLRALMNQAIAALQLPFLSAAQIAASRAVMGLDSQLVRDGTYLVAERDGDAVGCGGWSRRATLFGGDVGVVRRDPVLLDPTRDPARIRAMYTRPDQARTGIGRALLRRCEAEAAAAGFAVAELMSTLSGQPLYLSCGYRAIEPCSVDVEGVSVPLVRMSRRLDGSGD